MPRLMLLTPAEISRDPRARRAVATAHRHGLEAIGLCGRVSGEHPVELERIEIVRVGPRGRTDQLLESGLQRHTRSPIRRELVGLFRIARLGLRTLRLWRGGRALGRVDIVHANDLETLPAGWFLARSSKARLVYDAHELYSSFETDPPRLQRAVLLAVEAAIARRADAVITVNEPMASELTALLRLERPAIVVLNAPELEPESAGHASQGQLRAIYQGAFGPGRPLEELLEGVRGAPSVHLTLRVVRMRADTLRTEVERRGLEDRVTIEPAVSPDRLIEGLHGHDVGLIFDRPETRNTELSLPNKLFEYLMAGLAVVTPRLPVLAALVETEGFGLTYEPGRPAQLADALEQLAADRPGLEAMRRRARGLAVERYNAEAQEPALLDAWGVR